jgi:hypothetical protein
VWVYAKLKQCTTYWQLSLIVFLATNTKSVLLYVTITFAIWALYQLENTVMKGSQPIRLWLDMCWSCWPTTHTPVTGHVLILLAYNPYTCDWTCADLVGLQPIHLWLDMCW